jgi:hypothetical protein
MSYGRMEDTVPHPYSVEVETEPTGFRWKARQHGKLLERSHRLFSTAEKAHADAVESLQRRQHGDLREKRR